MLLVASFGAHLYEFQRLQGLRRNPSPGFIFVFIFEPEGRQANAKAQEAVDHTARSCQVERRFHSRKLNRQLLP